MKYITIDTNHQKQYTKALVRKAAPYIVGIFFQTLAGTNVIAKLPFINLQNHKYLYMQIPFVKSVH